MKPHISLALLFLFSLAPGASGVAAQEECVGPFPSWRNVKSDYGAVGDGRADDTTAIQRALDDLRLHRAACVLYFPRGTYRITRTVSTSRQSNTDCMGVTVVGQDPATTVIRWDGAADATMFQYDAWYSRISRLTLDGAGKAGTALAYGPTFSTYNETSDMVFKDVDTGIMMGVGDNGQAENMVLRCQFIRCSAQGLRTTSFNSLDVWAWYCRFEDCDYGLYNGAGNFHAYGCLFLRSRMADIGSRNLMLFSFVNNTSIGSRCFIDFSGLPDSGSPCSITGNRIIDPTSDWAIRLSAGGPYLVMDNFIRARPGVTQPVVQMTSGNQMFVGNVYTVLHPAVQAGRFRSIGERIVNSRLISEDPPVLPPTPADQKRPVFEVRAGAAAVAIQAAISAAVRLTGQRPVVHLPQGEYPIDRSLIVPSGSDLQLVGDGPSRTATTLTWTGTGAGPVIKLDGPSQATVRDLSIDAAHAIGICLDGCDQPGGLIYADQLELTGKSGGDEPRYGLLVSGLDSSSVVSLAQQGGNCQTWTSVVGGPRQQKGEPTEGVVGLFTGATATSDEQYAVQGGGKLLVRSLYHEVSGSSPQCLLLNDSGSLCVDATRFTNRTSPARPMIETDGFRGQFGLFTSLLYPMDAPDAVRIAISGQGQATNVLCLGDLFWEKGRLPRVRTVWQNTAVPPAHAVMSLCSQDLLPSGQFYPIADQSAATDAFILQMLQPIRSAQPRLPRTTSTGVTSVQFHRVISSAQEHGICAEFVAGRQLPS